MYDPGGLHFLVAISRGKELWRNLARSPFDEAYEIEVLEATSHNIHHDARWNAIATQHIAPILHRNSPAAKRQDKSESVVVALSGRMSCRGTVDDCYLSYLVPKPLSKH